MQLDIVSAAGVSVLLLITIKGFAKDSALQTNEIDIS